MKKALLIAILFLAPAMLAAGNAGPATDNGLVDVEALAPSEEGLVRIEIPGVDSRDFLARFSEDSLFIPFTMFCDFLRIRQSASADLSVLSGERAGGGTFTISRATNTAYIDSMEIPISSYSIRIVGGEAYVEHTLLANLLGITVYYDPMSLKLRVSPDDKLPVVQLKRKEERYGLLALGRKSGDVARTFPIERRFFGAPTLNWTLSNNFSSKVGASAGTLYLGQQFLFGTLELSGVATHHDNGLTNQIDARLETGRWSFQIPSSSIVRQIALGTLEVDGRRLHGLNISNAPLSPRAGYGTYELQGQSQPGWTIELYDGNRLVDVTRADASGRYAFQVPVSYGTMDRTTRQVGPYGETMIDHHRLQFNQNMVPAGELDYDVRYGVDSLRIDSRAGGRARVSLGLFERLTIGGEILYATPKSTEWIADSLTPKALATLWLGESSTLGFSYRSRTNLIGGEFYSISSWNSVLRAVVDSFSIEKKTFASALGVSIPIGPFTIGGNGGYAKRELGNEIVAEPQISGYAGGVSFIGSTRLVYSTEPTLRNPLQEDVTSTDFTWRAWASSLRLMYAPIPGVLLSAQGWYNHGVDELQTLDFTGYFRLNNFLGVNLGYMVSDLDWKKGAITAQMSLDLHPFRAIVTSMYQDGTTTTASYAQGGAVISTHGMRFVADPVVGQSAVLIEAFHDRNQNGVRDGDEELLDPPAARMAIAESELISDDGLFRLLPAYRECVIEIDRWSYAGDDLYPGRTHYEIYTMPSGVHTVLVPVTRGADISGRCVVEGESKPGDPSAFLNGIRVQLHATNGSASYDGEVFSDGTIFVAGVANGEYRIEFDAEQLRARLLCPPTITPTVKITDDQHRIPAVALVRCR